jgi:hypothetical protein
MSVALRGRGAVRNSQSGRHLGQRSCATASTGRTYDRKRSDQNAVHHPCEAGAVHIGHVYGLRCGSSHAAGPDGSSRIRSNSMPRARSALSRSGFPDPVSSTGAPSSPSTYLRLQQPHSHECLRSRDRSSVDSSFRHQGPDHTGHLVGQRHPDQHWRLAGQHAGDPRACRNPVAGRPA